MTQDGLGDAGDADEDFEQARRTCERARDPVGAVSAMVGRAEVLLERGLLDAAGRAFRRAGERADRLGAVSTSLRARMGAAHTAEASGDSEQSASLWRGVMSWADSVSDFTAAVRARESLIWLALARTDLARASAWLTELGEMLAPVPGQDAWCRYRLVGAAYLLAVGQAQGAQSWALARKAWKILRNTCEHWWLTEQ